MAKQGMKRPERTHTKPKNEMPPVPEIQGKAKHGKKPARSVIAGTHSPKLKVYHSTPYTEGKALSNAYPIYDNDLASDNLENDNDISIADLQDL